MNADQKWEGNNQRLLQRFVGLKSAFIRVHLRLKGLRILKRMFVCLQQVLQNVNTATDAANAFCIAHLSTSALRETVDSLRPSQ